MDSVNNGLSVLTSPSIVSNAETLYVSVDGGGVFKSTDFGDNWVSITSDLPTLHVYVVQLAPYVLAGTDSGVYLRLDGNTWGHLPTAGMTNTEVRFLALTHDSGTGYRLTAATPGGYIQRTSYFRLGISEQWPCWLSA